MNWGTCFVWTSTLAENCHMFSFILRSETCRYSIDMEMLSTLWSVVWHHGVVHVCVTGSCLYCITSIYNNIYVLKCILWFVMNNFISSFWWCHKIHCNLFLHWCRPGRALRSHLSFSTVVHRLDVRLSLFLPRMGRTQMESRSVVDQVSHITSVHFYSLQGESHQYSHIYLFLTCSNIPFRA